MPNLCPYLGLLFLMGMSKAAYVLPQGVEVEDIVNIAALAVVEAEGTKAMSESGHRRWRIQRARSC